MPRLLVRMKKRRDAGAVLVFVREDGTFTADDVGDPRGYGPVHDLTHYVVERALGLVEGFIGLCASGWEIADFAVRGAAATLPYDAVLAECAAGALSREAMMRQHSTVDEFNWELAGCIQRGGHPAPPTVSAETLAAMRAELSALRARWETLAPGDTLELPFETARASAVPRPGGA